MTYCVGVMLDEGLVFASDSRTNAGVDNISKFCKMTVFEYRGDRVIVLLSSGNLAGTQAVIGLLNKRCDVGSNTPSLWNARTMFDAAMLVADAMRDIERRDGVYLEPSDISFNASFITGLDWGEAPGGSQMSLPPIASPSVTLPPFAAACPPHWRRPPVRLPSQTVPPRSTGRR